MQVILTLSRNTRLLIERNDSLALSGFRVVSPRVPQEGVLLAAQMPVKALVLGHSVEPTLRSDIVQRIRRIRPSCVVVFVYRYPHNPDESLADVAVDVTNGPEALVEELRFRLAHSEKMGVLPEFLRTAIKVTGADSGNIQLFDPATHSLRIAAHQGFREDFLRFFAVVRDTHSACGSALISGSRVVVEDVATDPIFLGNATGEVMLRANSYAVQSTPLIAGSGQLIGMVSTHFRKPTRINGSRLRALDRLTKEYVARLETSGV